MSRGTGARLRKLEAKVGIGGDFADLASRMSDHELFEHSKALSEALVISYGGRDEALTGLLAEEGQASADFVLRALDSASAAEFMGYAEGWGHLVHERPRVR
jgi:hypothetical protein